METNSIDCLSGAHLVRVYEGLSKGKESAVNEQCAEQGGMLSTLADLKRRP